jgi:hypothetical protein
MITGLTDFARATPQTTSNNGVWREAGSYAAAAASAPTTTKLNRDLAEEDKKVLLDVLNEWTGFLMPELLETASSSGKDSSSRSKPVPCKGTWQVGAPIRQQNAIRAVVELSHELIDEEAIVQLGLQPKGPIANTWELLTRGGQWWAGRDSEVKYRLWFGIQQKNATHEPTVLATSPCTTLATLVASPHCPVVPYEAQVHSNGRDFPCTLHSGEFRYHMRWHATNHWCVERIVVQLQVQLPLVHANARNQF